MGKEEIKAIINAALKAVDPAEAIRKVVKRENDKLIVADRIYDLSYFQRIIVVGGGKAGAPMAAAVEEVLGERITGGWVNVKEGYILEPFPARIYINQAGHPTPNEAGFEGAKKIMEMVSGLGERDMVITLISGGGSALMPLPAEGITLEDKKLATSLLLRCGATINEMNALRKHISAIKGGQLAKAAYPATIISLILSDVVGSPLDTIASGPTAPDPTTFSDAWKVLEKYGILTEMPQSIVERLQRGMKGEIPETPKPGDPVFDRVQNVIIADNYIAATAALEEARRWGFNALLLTTFLEGEAREIGKAVAALGKEIALRGIPIPPPACLILGGETTVTIKGKGKGGRNQELALAAAIALEGWDEITIVTLATDGTDGPTDAAGAIVDGTTVRRGLEKGLSPLAYLQDNDSYTFFKALGDLLVTGPTNTNVNDLVFILVKR
ncbi:MAG: glycerate kinase [Anaerolineae bacterium]|nr:glycerate kinase [Anaerolineae bacterium]MDW8101786.1 glycerate kinase [Anaerolineae bacterium]